MVILHWHQQVDQVTYLMITIVMTYMHTVLHKQAEGNPHMKIPVL